MEPTLVAPTAVMEKKPWSQRPMYTALSFKLNRFLTSLAMPGFTLNSSPAAVNMLCIILIF